MIIHVNILKIMVEEIMEEIMTIIQAIVMVAQV